MIKRFYSWLISLLLICCISTSAVHACLVDRVDSPEQICILADAIVRVKAVENVKPLAERRQSSGGFQDAIIKFQVEETLKGEEVPATFLISGYLNDQDDFNEYPVPYKRMRGGGMAGCNNFTYKLGAEYLLFLSKEQDGSWSPYWSPLAATNEQLRPDDAWLKWVRDWLQKNRKRAFAGRGEVSFNMFGLRHLKDFYNLVFAAS